MKNLKYQLINMEDESVIAKGNFERIGEQDISDILPDSYKKDKRIRVLILFDLYKHFSIKIIIVAQPINPNSSPATAKIKSV